MALSRVAFDTEAFEDFMEWQQTDKNTFKKIKQLIKDIQRNPDNGVGKPEALKHNLAGWYSRRIDHEHRLVYRCEGESLIIASCRGHYSGLL